MAKKTNQNPDNSKGTDRLEEYLTVYDEAIIQKIRDEKMQLVTAEEFVGLHQEKLAVERKVEALKKRLEKNSDELLEKKFLDSGCAALLVHQDSEQNIIIKKFDYYPDLLVTKRDLAVLSAYTGYMFGEFQNFHGYAEEIVGHSIFTHQFGDKEMSEKLHNLSKDDFLQLHEKMIHQSEVTSDQ